MTQVNIHKYMHRKLSKKVCLGTVVISAPGCESIVDTNYFLFLVSVLSPLCPHLLLVLYLVECQVKKSFPSISQATPLCSSDLIFP